MTRFEARSLARWARSFVLPAFLTTVAALLASCSSGGDAEEQGGAEANQLELTGRVLDVRGDPVGDVLVEAPATSASTRTTGDGSFRIVISTLDPRLRIGNPEHAVFTVRVDVAGGGGVPSVPSKVTPDGDDGVPTLARKPGDPREVGRPFFVEFADDGYLATLPAGAVPDGVEIVIDDPSLDGLYLLLSSGTVVTYPSGAEEIVALLGLAGDRLPTPFPGGRLGRMAVWVGPDGLTFDRPVALGFPNPEGLPPGTVLDLVELDRDTGLWQVRGEVQVGPEGRSILGAQIRRGGLYAALPRVRYPTTDVVGRVIGSGSEPIPGYRIIAQGSYSAVSDGLGLFRIEDMPVEPGIPFRLMVISSLEFQHEFLLTGTRTPVVERGVELQEQEIPGEVDGEGQPLTEEVEVFTVPETDFGTINVATVLRNTFPPRVTFVPSNGQGRVDEVVRVRARYDSPMDLSSIGLKLVRGISREQGGVEGTLFLRFVGGNPELEFLALSPLQNGEFYSIFVPRESRDTQGVLIDPDNSLSRFTVRGAPAEVGPLQIRVHSVFPNDGLPGDTVTIFGENLSPEQVRFGDKDARVFGFDDTTRDFLEVRVPEDLAGEVAVTVKDPDDNFQGGIPFRPLPFIDSLDDTAVAGSGPSARQVTGRGSQLGGSPLLVWNGIRGGSIAYISDEDLCPEEVLERSKLKCFRLTLPAGVLSGSLYAEVDGIRTRGFFVVTRRDIDATPPRVTGVSVAEGGTVARDAVIRVTMSEYLDQRSRVLLSDAGGTVLASYTQDLVHLASGVSVFDLTPPAAGWPAGVSLVVRASTDVTDLAGNVLDQVAEPEGEEPRHDAFELGFTVEAAPAAP